MLRVGIAGLGFGAAVHAPVLAALPDVSIVAIAGSSRERAARVAKQLGIPYACGSIDELLAHDLDAVSFALPPKVNECALAQALDKNLPLLSEKPIAASTEVARKLAGRSSDNTTSVNFQFAELATFKTAREILEGHRFGEAKSVDVVWEMDSYAQQHRRWGWKTDAAQGGGVLSMLGSHLLFIAEWFFGPITTIVAQTSCTATSAFAPPGAKPADDRARLDVTFAHGLRLCGVIANAGTTRPLHEWRINCTDAVLRLRNVSNDYMAGFVLDADGTELTKESSALGQGRAAAFSGVASRFVSAARTRTHCTPDLNVGARVQELLDAAHASARTGQVQSVSPHC